MIAISIIHGVPYIWNADDACKLREEYRICGELIGSHPRFPRQSIQLALPLRLMKEEATLLKERGIAQLIDDSAPAKPPTQSELKHFHETREQLYQEQASACKVKRQQEIEQMLDKIREGRKAKKKKIQEAMRGRKSDVTKRCHSEVQKNEPCNDGPAGESVVESSVCTDTPSGASCRGNLGGHRQGQSKDMDSRTCVVANKTEDTTPQDVCDQSNKVKLQNSTDTNTAGNNEKNEAVISGDDRVESGGVQENSDAVPTDVCGNKQDMDSDTTETSDTRTQKLSKAAEVELSEKSEPVAMEVDDEDENEEEEELRVEDIPIHALPRKHAMVQIPVACVFREVPNTPATWTFPSTPLEKLRYSTFRDLWERGLYITVGQRFGGDFLVYPGDPLRYHAFYIAVCLLPDEPMTSLDLSTLGRLSTKVKKTTLLCSLDENNEITYTSLQWAAIT